MLSPKRSVIGLAVHAAISNCVAMRIQPQDAGLLLGHKRASAQMAGAPFECATYLLNMQTGTQRLPFPRACLLDQETGLKMDADLEIAD